MERFTGNFERAALTNKLESSNGIDEEKMETIANMNEDAAKRTYVHKIMRRLISTYADKIVRRLISI